VDVYRAFTELWFEREMWKQLIQHAGIHPSENRVQRYRALAQQISQYLFAAATSIPEAKIQLSLYDRPLVSGLPIHQNLGNIAFIHKSVQDFFTACNWIIALESQQSSAQDFFGVRLASSEAGLLKFLAQMYDYHDHHVALINVVLASRTSDSQSTRSVAAANAITILNYARFSFSGMDLSGINIKGAVLDNALLDKTNLSTANLTNVSMREVWAPGADFSNATLSNVWFGREADIILKGECCGVVSGHNGFVTMTLDGDIYTLNNTSRIPVTVEQWTCFTVYDDTLFAGTSKGTIYADDLTRNSIVIRSKRIHQGTVQCITVFAGMIFTGSSDSTICVWDISSGGVVKQLVNGHTNGVLCIKALSGRIISGDGNGTLCMWNVATGKQIISLHAGGGVRCLEFFEGKIVSGTDDAQIRIWDIATFKQVGDTLQGHKESVTTLACFDGKIISGSADGTVHIWDFSTGKQVGDPLAIHIPVVSIVVWERKVYVGCKRNRVQVWDISSKPQLQADDSLKGFTERINSVAMILHRREGMENERENIAIAVAGDREIQLLDAVTPRQLMNPLMGSRHGGTAITLCSYNSELVSTGGGALIKWDITTGKKRQILDIGHTMFLEVLIPFYYFSRNRLPAIHFECCLLKFSTYANKQGVCRNSSSCRMEWDERV
jgi:WD40 repeat protein